LQSPAPLLCTDLPYKVLICACSQTDVTCAPTSNPDTPTKGYGQCALLHMPLRYLRNRFCTFWTFLRLMLTWRVVSPHITGYGISPREDASPPRTAGRRHAVLAFKARAHYMPVSPTTQLLWFSSLQ